MKCEEYRLLMMDLMYEEIEDADRQRLETHLAQCAECRAELARLQSTVSTLSEWEDVDPQLNLTFVNEPKRSLWGWLPRFRPGQWIKGVGFAMAGLLLILSVSNTRIQVRDGAFTMQLGLFGTPATEPVANFVTAEQIEEYNSQNMTLFTQLLEEYSRQNKMETVMLLDGLYDEIENNRKKDLQLVSRTLEDVHYGTAQRLDRTDQALGTLIRYVNMQTQSQNQR